MKIGIIGGAFDPITIAHLRLGEEILSNKLLDQVWYMPCYISYYDKKMVSPEDRLEMCRLAIESRNNPNLQVCDYEIVHKSTGNSSQIWDELMITYNSTEEHKFYFIIGEDNALKIHTWCNPEVLLNKIPFLVVPRNIPQHIREKYKFTPWYYNPPHLFLNTYQSDDISSTLVRSDIKTKGSSDLVTQDVKSYILNYNLYS